MLKELLQELQLTATKLVAVTKTHPVADIETLYNQGQRRFGENRPKEMAEKHPQLPADVEWHFIGHLQSSNVKYIAPFVSLIHSVESLSLLQEINRQAAKHGRVIPCLLQFKIAQEESKYGLDLPAARELLESEAFRQMDHIRIAGVMGMATFTEDTGQIRAEFGKLKQYFETLHADFFANDPGFCEISMGMSGDYKIAMEEGSTMVRIGSLLFGR
ncbi:MAG: YggS family pyridoxal phosphate-dependent enzyme [Saprospiraceae bacterium]|nr:YggS family pyridoxal phosphate-dependent enzyme [Saprospiraceae bacterium]MDZ4702819.1 YggS family pyridoxal phosphate-dependent enzyme [Saprospiraceae bacterium]